MVWTRYAEQRVSGDGWWDSREAITVIRHMHVQGTEKPLETDRGTLVASLTSAADMGGGWLPRIHGTYLFSFPPGIEKQK